MEETKMKLTVKETGELKRMVKKATGRNIKDIEIEAFSDDFIEYSFYSSGYDRAKNRKTYDRIALKKMEK